MMLDDITYSSEPNHRSFSSSKKENSGERERELGSEKYDGRVIFWIGRVWFGVK